MSRFNSETGWDRTVNKIEKGPIQTAKVALSLMMIFGVFVFAPIFMLSGGIEYVKTKWYNPVIESNKREAFEQTRSYITGGIEELRRCKREYDLAKEDEKSIIAASIRDQFAQYDRAEFPADLQNFLQELDTVQ